MGQKVHPIGFRLGRTGLYWKSQWFAVKDYSNILHSELQVRKYLYGYFYGMGILLERCWLKVSFHQVFLTIFYYKLQGLDFKTRQVVLSRVSRLKIDRLSRQLTAFTGFEFRILLHNLRWLLTTQWKSRAWYSTSYSPELFSNKFNLDITNQEEQLADRNFRLKAAVSVRFSFRKMFHYMKGHIFFRDLINIVVLTLVLRRGFLLCSFIVRCFWKFKHQHFFLRLLAKVVSALNVRYNKVFGLTVQIKGKRHASSMTSLRSYRFGPLPLSTISVEQGISDFVYMPAESRLGTYGISCFVISKQANHTRVDYRIGSRSVIEQFKEYLIPEDLPASYHRQRWSLFRDLRFKSCYTKSLLNWALCEQKPFFSAYSRSFGLGLFRRRRFFSNIKLYYRQFGFYKQKGIKLAVSTNRGKLLRKQLREPRFKVRRRQSYVKLQVPYATLFYKGVLPSRLLHRVNLFFKTRLARTFYGFKTSRYLIKSELAAKLYTTLHVRSFVYLFRLFRLGYFHDFSYIFENFMHKHFWQFRWAVAYSSQRNQGKRVFNAKDRVRFSSLGTPFVFDPSRRGKPVPRYGFKYSQLQLTFLKANRNFILSNTEFLLQYNNAVTIFSSILKQALLRLQSSAVLTNGLQRFFTNTNLVKLTRYFLHYFLQGPLITKSYTTVKSTTKNQSTDISENRLNFGFYSENYRLLTYTETCKASKGLSRAIPRYFSEPQVYSTVALQSRLRFLNSRFRFLFFSLSPESLFKLKGLIHQRVCWSYKKIFRMVDLRILRKVQLNSLKYRRRSIGGVMKNSVILFQRIFRKFLFWLSLFIYLIVFRFSSKFQLKFFMTKFAFFFRQTKSNYIFARSNSEFLNMFFFNNTSKKSVLRKSAKRTRVR